MIKRILQLACAVSIAAIITGFIYIHEGYDSVFLPSPTIPPVKTDHPITLPNGLKFSLRAPENYSIDIAAEGMNKIRFMAMSPDGRLFVTDIHDASDNKLGKIYILTKFDSEKNMFDVRDTYLENLRNPNSIAFYEDTNGVNWLYIALTDKLIRYKYQAGDMTPQTKPEVISTFPDYGQSVKNGGWNFTRTVAIHNDKIYVSIGSSCNSCEEKEAVRASILQMDPDGSNVTFYAKGLRNAVGLRWIGDELYATDMGVDHLGPTLPNDMLYDIQPGANYGWPYCYVNDGKVEPDTSINWQRKNLDCSLVSSPYAYLLAHAAPLGLDSFQGNMLVALHGSGDSSIGTGYGIVQVGSNGQINNLITGFLHNGQIFGRPVDILANTDSSFFFTDDYNGVLYFVSTKR